MDLQAVVRQREGRGMSGMEIAIGVACIALIVLILVGPEEDA